MTSTHTSIVQGAPCTAIREVSLLKDLKHANIGEWGIWIFSNTTKDQGGEVIITLGGAYEAYLIIC